jgi:ceramide glucosyltransferase
VVVEYGYLRGIVAHLEDERVGLVTHAVAGAGEQRLGSLLDNLHMAADVGPGMVAAKRVVGKDIVVGKSMALRRADLVRLGGFESVADVLAEDYVLGRRVARELGKRVVVAHRPVWNVSQGRSVRDFLARYRRWAVIHRHMVGTLVYSGELVLNPLVLSLLALALAPSRAHLGFALAVLLGRAAVDALAASSLRPTPLRPLQLAALPLKDGLLAAAWLHGLLRSTVDWRGNRLRVLPGTRLARPAGEPVLDGEPQLLEDAV